MCSNSGCLLPTPRQSMSHSAACDASRTPWLCSSGCVKSDASSSPEVQALDVEGGPVEYPIRSRHPVPQPAAKGALNERLRRRGGGRKGKGATRQTDHRASACIRYNTSTYFLLTHAPPAAATSAHGEAQGESDASFPLSLYSFFSQVLGDSLPMTDSTAASHCQAAATHRQPHPVSSAKYIICNIYIHTYIYIYIYIYI
jgi:hypothetical protein